MQIPSGDANKLGPSPEPEIGLLGLLGLSEDVGFFSDRAGKCTHSVGIMPPLSGDTIPILTQIAQVPRVCQAFPQIVEPPQCGDDSDRIHKQVKRQPRGLPGTSLEMGMSR